MKESAPKRQKKKSAGEIGEAEYTPIRRRRTKNPGSVMLSEDEISVAYNRLETQSCEQEEITATLTEYEEHKAYADSYRKELEAGEQSDNGYHEFLQGMADREIISLHENYGIVTNIKIEGWEPASH